MGCAEGSFDSGQSKPRNYLALLGAGEPGTLWVDVWWDFSFLTAAV